MTNKFDNLYQEIQKKSLNNERKLKRNLYESHFEIKSILLESSKLFRELTPIKRKIFLIHVVEELYEKQAGICPLCKDVNNPIRKNEFDVDHIIPWSWGGGNEKSNLQITHPSCNRSKGSNIEDIGKLITYFEDKMMNL